MTCAAGACVAPTPFARGPLEGKGVDGEKRLAL